MQINQKDVSLRASNYKINKNTKRLIKERKRRHEHLRHSGSQLPVSAMNSPLTCIIYYTLQEQTNASNK